MEFKILTHCLTQKVDLKHFPDNSKRHFILTESSELKSRSVMQRLHTTDNLVL